MSRRLLASVLALALAPGTWVRSGMPPADFMPPIPIHAIELEPQSFGTFRLLRGWELRPGDPRAGGYSALLWRGGDRLLAASDNGRLIELTGPDFASATQRRVFTSGTYDKVSGDVEALAGGADGPVWAAAEGRNAITRATAALRFSGEVQPQATDGWWRNAGMETLARLPDGRFLAVAERGRSGRHAGIIFAGDPVEAEESEDFRLKVPDGFRPVDAVAAPDGMLLVLLRRLDWSVPPGFVSAIARYDVAALEAGRTWSPKDISVLPSAIPADNYEGIALRPERGGAATIWLISDDNLAAFQRSLLLELSYRPKRKRARGSSARPSRDRE